MNPRALPCTLLLAFASACNLPDQQNGIELRGIGATLDEASSDEVEEPQGVGIALLGMPVYDAYLPVAWEVGVQQLTDEGELSGVDQDLTYQVAWFGMRGEFRSGRLRPHLGIGAVYAQSELETTFGNVTNLVEYDSFGAYVEGGARWLLTKNLHLGGAVRQTVLLEDSDDGSGQDVDLDFLEFYLSLGLRF